MPLLSFQWVDFILPLIIFIYFEVLIDLLYLRFLGWQENIDVETLAS